MEDKRKHKNDPFASANGSKPINPELDEHRKLIQDGRELNPGEILIPPLQELLRENKIPKPSKK